MATSKKGKVSENKVASVFYGFREAATVLGCSVRTVYNYVEKGYIRRVYQKQTPVLLKEDIDSLALRFKNAGPDLPPVTPESQAMLLVRIERLERDMNLAKHILQIKDSPLRPSPVEAKQLFNHVSASLVVGKWHREEIEMWASVFESIDEVTLTSLFESGLGESPYRPFLELCVAQLKQLSTAPGFQTDLEAQLLHKRLDEGRRKLQACLLSFLYITGRDIPESVLSEVSKKASLMARLAKRAKTPDPSA